jgi:hypothetical protein
MRKKITAWSLIGALTALAVFFMVSCTADPVSTTQTNNKDIQVDLLFVHDGCSVYRFEDSGHYVYYTVCDGSNRSSASWEQQVGKTSYSTQVETVRR